MFDCICGKVFSKKYDLQQHQNSPTACNPNRNICASCQMVIKHHKRRHEISCFKRFTPIRSMGAVIPETMNCDPTLPDVNIPAEPIVIKTEPPETNSDYH
ncbi:hypothetical protein HA402_010675 [Bradysia odoriphaga]|nr:hypothetical protein HA402_010675 [Bradysia odoriphaga]